MKALILGLGLSGKSAKNFLEKRGWEVVGIDDKSAPKNIESLETFDLFVPSPGISPKHPLYQKALQAQILIKGEAQLALEEITQTCVGVTGTNGKTTTVKLIEHCLNASGKKAKALGNVGQPLTSYSGNDILIVELSSFQLETLGVKVFDLALVLNIAPDHLDRYSTIEEYAQAKARIQNCIKLDGKLLIHESVDSSLFTKPFECFNEDGAWLVCKELGVDRADYITGVKTFVKPSHRLEFVAQKNGIKFFNDSKSTNIASVLHGLKQMEGKVILLAGGLDKGLSFEALAAAKNPLSSVIVFGQAREKIANALQHLVEVHKVGTVEEAVNLAKSLAKAGESVLFSPGCASFDAYRNYEERGEEFKQLVRRRDQ